jgi:hypothetical protein
METTTTNGDSKMEVKAEQRELARLARNYVYFQSVSENDLSFSMVAQAFEIMSGIYTDGFAVSLWRKHIKKARHDAVTA